MKVRLQIAGVADNDKTKLYKCVLKETNGKRTLIIDIPEETFAQTKAILEKLGEEGDNGYNGIFYLYGLTIGKFGFKVKVADIDTTKELGTITINDEFNNEIKMDLPKMDAILLAHCNNAGIFIEEEDLNGAYEKGEKKYINYDLKKYSISELYRMLKKAKYDDSFLEEAARIKGEILEREAELKKTKDQYNDDSDLNF